MIYKFYEMSSMNQGPKLRVTDVSFYEVGHANESIKSLLVIISCARG